MPLPEIARVLRPTALEWIHMIKVSASVRTYLVFVAITSALVGGSLYAVPTWSVAFWPYSMRPLATQMFASLFLAVALAAGLALRVSRLYSLRILLIQGAAISGLILLAAVPSYLPPSHPSLGAFAWLTLFTIYSAGSVVLLLAIRSTAETAVSADSMLRLIPKALKICLLLHTVIVVIFGLQMLTLPDLALNFWPWKVSANIMRGLGGLFVGVTVGSGWAYLQKYWEDIRAVFPSYTAFATLVLLAVGLHWDVITAESPGLQVTVIWIILYIFTALYPAYFYLQLEKR